MHSLCLTLSTFPVSSRMLKGQRAFRHLAECGMVANIFLYFFYVFYYFFLLHVYSSSSFLGLPWKRSKGLELTYRRSLILVPDLASALHLWRNRVSDKGSRIILSRFAEPGRDAWVAAPRPFMMSSSFETHIWVCFFPPPKIITLSPKRSWSFLPNFSLRKKSI